MIYELYLQMTLRAGGHRMKKEPILDRCTTLAVFRVPTPAVLQWSALRNIGILGPKQAAECGEYEFPRIHTLARECDARRIG